MRRKDNWCVRKWVSFPTFRLYPAMCVATSNHSFWRFYCIWQNIPHFDLNSDYRNQWGPRRSKVQFSYCDIVQTLRGVKSARRGPLCISICYGGKLFFFQPLWSLLINSDTNKYWKKGKCCGKNSERMSPLDSLQFKWIYQSQKKHSLSLTHTHTNTHTDMHTAVLTAVCMSEPC